MLDQIDILAFPNQKRNSEILIEKRITLRLFKRDCLSFYTQHAFTRLKQLGKRCNIRCPTHGTNDRTVVESDAMIGEISMYSKQVEM